MLKRSDQLRFCGLLAELFTEILQSHCGNLGLCEFADIVAPQLQLLESSGAFVEKL